MRPPKVPWPGLFLALMTACRPHLAPSPAPARPANSLPTGTAPSAAASAAAGTQPTDETYAWEAETVSPRPPLPDATAATLLDQCQAIDGALTKVAERLARRQAARLPQLEMPEIAFALRAAGSPYVWARAWTVEGIGLGDSEARERVVQWLATFDDGGERRCGAGHATAPDGATVIAVLALDAVADLDPMPTAARSGQWLTLKSSLLRPSSEAKVVVLGPSGLPVTVPTSVERDLVRAAFSVDRPGSWLVQLLATGETGPRPVAEAIIHVDQVPPSHFRADPVPGERSVVAQPEAEEHLLLLVNAARATEGLAPVARDARLEAIAQTHAEQMLAEGRVGHDVGGGGPRERVERAGIPVTAAGENVAHAATVLRAHRALWSSPSHRGNLLHARFSSVGIGVARDTDGTVWVCQVFADF